MLRKLVSTILGDPNEREVRKLQPQVDEINALEPDYTELSDAALRAKTDEFKARLDKGESLEDLLPEAFAAVREASRRTIGLRHYDVQLVGGIVLHQGKIAEMKTGEGKTLVATMPLYLNALLGRGAHLVTPNDYLSKLGVQWMGPIYHLLGVSAAVIQSQGSDGVFQPAYIYDPGYESNDDRYQHLRPISRYDAYRADITYGTNNEFGFDYLRDNMVRHLSQRVQRELYYAIVDEVDNILIDEARTPLIISGPAEESSDLYQRMAQVVRSFKGVDQRTYDDLRKAAEAGDRDAEARLRRYDFVVDEKARVTSPLESGIEKAERTLGVQNLYDPANFELTHYLDNAVRAHGLYQRDRDYIVTDDGQVIIVDEFTGRLMYGRRFSEGLHQAIEAKEGVAIQRENMTLATITFQNYFRMYEKLAGMTGTALTEAEEFHKIYKLDVVAIPTDRPVIRNDLPDVVYKNERGKYNAVLEEIKEMHELGRPVLVGTASIERSEHLSHLLKQAGIPHEVLNAKYHEREAEIIAQAGHPGAVTIATNMAGRGVDILLGGNAEGLARRELRRKYGGDLSQVSAEEYRETLRRFEEQVRRDREQVISHGGLHIVGTERHEARRIDNQLRGRAGRQGDPGSSRFYLSLEDDLMRRFGGQNIIGLMDRFGLEDDMPIEHGMVTKAIENAQVRVEGYNFDIRKHVLEYDDVVNKQREVIYGQRYEVLSEENLRPQVERMLNEEISHLVATYVPDNPTEEPDFLNLYNAVRTMIPLPPEIQPSKWEKMAPDEIEEQLQGLVTRLYDERERSWGPELTRQIERQLMLDVVDHLWVRHLTALDELRDGIGLRAIAQQDPLVAYKREAYDMFHQLVEQIEETVVHSFFAVQPMIVQESEAPRQMYTNRDGAAAADGKARPVKKEHELGRNDPCWCGSGKKYKKCHWREDQAKAKASRRERRPVANP
ncbi:MAG: preprotein translocase subunit SecA [Ardenticatenaceae bacterium]|nr:preprotein translocase subunit SecA [Ardenticatenaceae bacterium]HBY93947.1 preprotein translocase subunit SecA [Chloroflexota bacterium]